MKTDSKRDSQSTSKIPQKLLRIKPTYTTTVKIPKEYKTFFWDCPQGKVFLEKFIMRILQYGRFEDLKWVYKKYPEETYDIAFKYPEIKRGVKFWIKWWGENGI